MLVPAYVLHQHDWRESSRLVEILSRDQGRLGLVARGLAAPPRRGAVCCDLFSLCCYPGSAQANSVRSLAWNPVVLPIN